MTPKKAHLTGRLAERVADTMFALSTPSRVQILACLMDGPHAVVDIMKTLEMEQSAVSHQLRVLRDHRLVKADRKGRRRVYALQDEHVLALLEEAVGHAEQRSGEKDEKKRKSSGDRGVA